MAKGFKAVLIVSLLLNLVLIIGFLSYKNYVKSQFFGLAAITAQSETIQLENILSDIESDDTARITALKERLHRYIEQGQKTSAIWQKAATQ
ncbi:MAG: hypothetical protein NTW55_00130 [Planctomycetota bacterium]|nr:hypothetical protein [Planctomycetota bacterium]